MYIKRSPDGEIELVSRHATPDCTEFLAGDAEEWRAFLEGGGDARQGRWRQSDQDFVRVLEDLLEALLAGDVLKLEDLPAAAREKLADRRLMRYQHQVERAVVESRFEEQH